MPTLRLTNTRTRRKEPFEPLDAQNVRMYVCGPTVYDRAHLGNARPVVVFDVLFRLLRHLYGADHVTYVRNFTDVDDKINARAAETGRPIRAITDETIGWYHADMDALGAVRPTHEPRATDFIPQMIAMTEALVARGHAYAAQGHVLFRVRSYAAYGQLSGRSVDDMIAGSRVEVAPFKEDPLDFVLWKPSNEATPGWDSPWGRGRPGWHIECSAMAQALLGESFDLHGGGLDLQFPHHENEIAQSACAHPEGQFARFWLHNEMLLVDGKKMSKSLGNFFTVRDLLDQGIPGEVIRFVLLGTQYGKPMDWTEQKVDQARGTLARWHNIVGSETDFEQPHPEVTATLSDDLNTAGAIAVVDRLIGEGDLARSRASIALLGIELDNVATWKPEPVVGSAAGSITPSGSAEGIVVDTPLSIALSAKLRERDQARADRNYARSDQIRDTLAQWGLSISDGATGSLASIDWTAAYAQMLLEVDPDAFSRMTGMDKARTASWLAAKIASFD